MAEYGDLKMMLMMLGNKLVAKGFTPASMTNDQVEGTKPIEEFTKWVNKTPEAQETLKEMGFDWSMPNSSPTTNELIAYLYADDAPETSRRLLQKGEDTV